MVTVIIESNIKDVQRFMGNLPESIRRVGTRSVNQLGQIGKNFAQMIAPVSTGRLRQGISVTNISSKQEARIISVAVGDSGFTYNLWVNREPTHLLLDPKVRDNPRYFNTTQPPFMYGQGGVKTSGGNTVRWTGQAGYFDKAFIHVVGKADDVFVNNLEIELKR